MDTPKRRGRKPLPNRDLLQDEVIQWISAGKSLMSWCAQEGKPDRSTVCRWTEKDPEFAQRFARARDEGCDVMAEELLHLAASKPGTFVDAAGNERIDPGAVQWHRLRVDTVQKMLACWQPKKYGTKVGVEHAGGVAITVTTGVPDS